MTEGANMTRDEALKKMKAPGDERGKACYGVMQLAITSHCDGGRCSNCTQLLAYRQPRHMRLENALAAIDSVADYPGVIGIFGGNPCLHPDFEKISRHLAEVIPDRRRRGLWTNNMNGHGDLIGEVYGYYNINVHGNVGAAAAVRRDLPGVTVWGERAGESVHGAVLPDLAAVLPSEADRWALIAECDVNQRWSPAIVELGGRAKGFFCEVAAAWADVCGHRSGVKIAPGWWRRPMADFAAQVDRYCHGCGVPLRMAGRPDSDRKDDVTAGEREQMAARENRLGEVVNAESGRCRELTDYMRLREAR